MMTRQVANTPVIFSASSQTRGSSGPRSSASATSDGSKDTRSTAACTTAAGFTAWIVAMLTPYMSGALRAFSLGESALSEGLAWMLMMIATFVTTLMSKFAEFNPREQITEGLLFSWADLADCVLWNGVIQTGILALLAWLIYRRRELAKVQV